MLEPRVPWLNIAAPLGTPAGDLVVTLDGGTVQPVAWGKVSAPSPYRVDYTTSTVEGSTQVGAGLGFEVAWRLVELPRASLVLNATPFFFLGTNGNAFALPLGIAYRFQ